jgi:hypothetical protein
VSILSAYFEGDVFGLHKFLACLNAPTLGQTLFHKACHIKTEGGEVKEENGLVAGEYQTFCIGLDQISKQFRKETKK